MSDQCIHCLLAKVLRKHLETRDDISVAEITYNLGEIVRDLLASAGYQDMANAPPEVIGPVLQSFMKGIGLKVGEPSIIRPNIEAGTRH